jgi:NDP-sugar pyrophosphorylase family protein
VSLSAILLTGKRSFSPTMGESAGRQSEDAGPASFACVELFGQSILERTILRLQQAGVRNISVVASSICVEFVAAKNVAVTIAAQPDDCWPTVKRLFQNHVQRGTDTVLIADLGAYVEFDVAKALQFHMAKRQAVTPLHDAHTSLSYWFVDASQAMPSRALAFPPDEDRMADRPVPYLVDGYVNQLADAHDFRRLVVDAFFGRTSITPSGREIKPGVWIDSGARVHKSARLVGPVYIGRSTRVHPGAVISRCTSLERNCSVGQGSLIVNSSILPHTIVGRGLDICAAVVDGSDFIHLHQNVTVHIEDPYLVSSAVSRPLQLPAYLPQYEGVDRRTEQLEVEYSQYLSRAAGRLLEVFKGQV